MSQLRHNIGMRARALFFTIFGDKIDANFQAYSRSDPDSSDLQSSAGNSIFVSYLDDYNQH